MKMKLNKSAIDRVAAPATGRLTVHDTATPGLCVRITSNDSRTFYTCRWHGGRVLWVRLGDVAEMSVDEAQRMARKKNSDIRADVDPNAVKRQDRQAATLGDLWKAYTAIAKVHPRTWIDYEHNWRLHLSPWANRRLTDIDKNEVRKLHARIAEGWMDRLGGNNRRIHGGPVVANRTVALLSIMFNAAGEDFGVAINPAAGGRRGIQRSKESPRERFLNDLEIGLFLSAVDALDKDLAKDFIRLALFTGQRRANLQAMKWEDISIPFATWTIERDEMKAGRGHVVPLVPQVLAILKRRRETLGEDAVWVFPTASKSGHIEEPKKAITMAAKAAGIPALSTHDLRRTCGTWLNSTGASEGTIAALLAHKRQTVTGAVYVKATLDTVRGALVKAVDAMETAAAAKTEPAAAAAAG